MRVIVALYFALIVSAQAQPAQAQDSHHDGHLGHGHSHWHDKFYNKLIRPDAKTSCCNLTDCRPTSGRMVNGYYEVKVNGVWVSVPQSKIVPISAPDGGYHVCAPINFKGQPDDLYCVVLAPEG